MKISNKLRKQLEDAVGEAAKSVLNQHCPAHLDGPPEIWPDHEKDLWDLITETEYRVTKNVDALLNGTAPDRLPYTGYGAKTATNGRMSSHSRATRDDRVGKTPTGLSNQ